MSNSEPIQLSAQINKAVEDIKSISDRTALIEADLKAIHDKISKVAWGIGIGATLLGVTGIAGAFTLAQTAANTAVEKFAKEQGTEKIQKCITDAENDRNAIATIRTQA